MNYEFDLQINDSYKDIEDIEEWGCAFLWLDDNRGVEYNFCIDNSTNEHINCSAIYPAYVNSEGYMENDTSWWIHYEIDFNEPQWREKLEMAMFKAAKKYY